MKILAEPELKSIGMDFKSLGEGLRLETFLWCRITHSILQMIMFNSGPRSSSSGSWGSDPSLCGSKTFAYFIKSYRLFLGLEHKIEGFPVLLLCSYGQGEGMPFCSSSGTVFPLNPLVRAQCGVFLGFLWCRGEWMLLVGAVVLPACTCVIGLFWNWSDPHVSAGVWESKE